MERAPRSAPISLEELHSRFRDWLVATNEDSIGAGKVSAWIHVRTNGNIFRFNADIKQVAVQQYLAIVDGSSEQVLWRVVPTRSGEESGVGFGVKGERIKFFNAYLK